MADSTETTRPTYRERREAKAERLRDWADKREAKAESAYTAARTVADQIPFGQPILVGHHSQRRAERDADRIHRNMGKSFEHSKKAEEMRRKAANIESAADAAIYSDDPDACERLADKIATLEAERDRIKRYNATARKGSPDLTILTDAERKDLESVLRYAPYQSKNGAFPSYVLSNLGKKIKTARDRLADLEAK